MGSAKVHAATKSLIWVMALAAALNVSADAAELQWLNCTSQKEVRRMTFVNDTLYLSTSGGILAVSDPVERGRHYSNLDGLGTNDLTDLILAADGQKWATGYGRLVNFDGDVATQFPFFDGEGNLFGLTRLADDGDNLWVGSDLGLVLFSKTIDGGQIQDSYQLFGDLNPAPVINDILLTGDSIWIATTAGLAAADRSNPSLLKAPSNWAVYGPGRYPELETDTIYNVVAYESSIYVGTSRALFRLDVDEFSGDTSFVEIPIASNLTYTRAKVENDSLFVYYDDDANGGLAVIVGGEVSQYFTNGLPSAPVTGGGDGVRRWVGVQSGGVYYQQDGTWIEYPYTGLPGNDITDITINREGLITAAFRTVSVSQLVDSIWNEYDFWVRQGTSVLMTDSLDRNWMGTIGNGLWLEDGDSLANYDETNTTMIGNTDALPSSASFVIITGLATDGNYFYAACYRALTRYPVVIGDMNNLNDPTAWDSIGVDHGLSDERVVSLDLYSGHLAVGTEADGVYVCEVGANPFDHRITCTHYTRENSSFLISNSVRTVRFSPEGILWVGTNFGLSRFDPGIDRFVDVNLPAEISSDVSAMAFDSRSNLWVGTREGVARFDATTGDFEIYNTLNSGLVANEVNNITYDQFTGDLYIATTGGFSLIPSMTGEPVFDVEEVVAFPNPFVISGGDARLNFNFGRSGTVKIYNLAGEPIIEIPVNTSWDGRNQEGKEVASGVYVFIITDNNGEIGRGKFLLIRR